MRLSSSTCRSAACALAVGVVSLVAQATARAQPCCGGASAFAPARLTLHEDGLIGLSARAAGVVRSFDAHGAVVTPPAGTREVDLEQDVVGALRVLTRGQVSFLVPLVETVRRVPGRTETGGGYGDIQLGARWDFKVAGPSTKWPGIAALGTVTLPTGVPTDQASKPLATDATGTGALHTALGAAVEQTFGSVLLNVTGTGAWRAPRSVGSLRVQPGLLFTAFAGASVYLPREAVLALSASYTAELATRADGEVVDDSARSFTRLTLGGGPPTWGPWRVQGSFFSDLPIAKLGQNQPVSLGAALLFVRGFS